MDHHASRTRWPPSSRATRRRRTRSSSARRRSSGPHPTTAPSTASPPGEVRDMVRAGSSEMSKRLLIPVFALTVAAFGCSSSSINTTDGGAGKTGAAGSTAGSGGSTAGSAGAGGSTAGSGGSTAGSSGGAAGADAGAAGADDGLTPPSCLAEDWSPSMFCMILLGFCGNANPGYTTMAECMTTYAAVGVATPNKQLCESGATSATARPTTRATIGRCNCSHATWASATSAPADQSAGSPEASRAGPLFCRGAGLPLPLSPCDA